MARTPTSLPPPHHGCNPGATARSRRGKNSALFCIHPARPGGHRDRAALLVAVSACSSSSSPSKTPATRARPAFPTVKGSYGTKPTLTFPSGTPSTSLQVKVLSEGKGPVVANGELMVADYLGQIWHGKVFDNSYDRKEPIATPIGVGQVIKGWDTGAGRQARREPGAAGRPARSGLRLRRAVLCRHQGHRHPRVRGRHRLGVLQDRPSVTPMPCRRTWRRRRSR